MSWNTAQIWVKDLNVHGVTGWRLPDVKPVNGTSFNTALRHDGTSDVGYNITSPQSELAHLFHVTLGNEGPYDTLGRRQTIVRGQDNTGPFSNVQNSYWSDVAHEPGFAWSFFFATARGGDQSLTSDSLGLYAWAVRSGDIAVVPEPSIHALLLAGLTMLATARGRRRQ